MLPVYCSLVEVLILQFRGGEAIRRQTRLLHGVLAIGYVVGGVLVLANFSSLVLDGYEVRDFTLTERVMTQFRVFVTYLTMIVLPVQRRMGFFHDDFAISTGLLNPATTLVSIIAIGALLFAAVRFRAKTPLFAFGILFFFATHLLESTVFPLEIMFEHRNYLGLAGIVIALASLLPTVLKEKRALIAICVVIATGLAGLTWQRALTWSTPFQFYFYVYNAHPTSQRLNLIFSSIHASGGDFERARLALEQVDDGPGTAVHSLFLDCLENGHVDRQAISTATSVNAGIVDAHATSSIDSLTNALLEGRCTAPAEQIVQLFDFLSEFPARSVDDVRSVQLTKARYLESIGEHVAALETLIAAAETIDDDALPIYLAAGVLVRAGELDDARRMLTRAYEMEQTIRIQRKGIAESLYAELATAFLVDGEVDKAIDTYEEAIESMPRYASSYVQLAEIALAAGRPAEAMKVLERIDAESPRDIEAFAHRVARVQSTLNGETTVGQSYPGSGNN